MDRDAGFFGLFAHTSGSGQIVHGVGLDAIETGLFRTGEFFLIRGEFGEFAVLQGVQ